jgi:RNA polymerase sigma factor (sigma-70 family)
VNSQTDQQLLRDYTGHRSETAFAELVRRHVDLVYSAALRMVRDAHLAEDVTQGVFIALAQNAGQLTERPVLSGWLHRTAQNLAANAVRSDVRRRAREQEAVAMNELLATESDAAWEHIAPHLDAALGELGEADRDALLLRYFESKSAREMAQTLGTSEEAAQKRCGRAVERLRDFFAKRGVTVGASGLVVALSTNAVQAAPVGLAAIISTAAAFAGTTSAATSTVTATNAMAITTMQKTLITAAVAAAAMTAPLVIQHQAQTRLRSENEALRQQVTQMSQSVAKNVTTAPTNSTNSAPALANERFLELLRLRAEVTRLRLDAQERESFQAGNSKTAGDPMTVELNSWLARVNELKQKFDQRPDLKIPELQFLTPRDWLNVALDAKLDTDSGARLAFSRLRTAAKQAFSPVLRQALNSHAQASGGQSLAEVSQLKPYFNPPVDDALLDRYQLVHPGRTNEAPAREPGILAERAPVDADFDSLLSVELSGTKLDGKGGGSGFGFGSSFSRVTGYGGGTNSTSSIGAGGRSGTHTGVSSGSGSSPPKVAPPVPR